MILSKKEVQIVRALWEIAECFMKFYSTAKGPEEVMKEEGRPTYLKLRKRLGLKKEIN